MLDAQGLKSLHLAAKMCTQDVPLILNTEVGKRNFKYSHLEYKDMVYS